MSRSARILPTSPFRSLDEYRNAGGGKGLDAARAVEPSVIIDELAASGLRGRGGAGFPTGVKWRTVADYASEFLVTAVVVNAAEGEPGTFKDRAIMRANPYAVLEGALIAAKVVGATAVTLATKARFGEDLVRIREAIAEVIAAGWADGVEITIVDGPVEYLYGEETALLEVLDGRPPFPRIAPPFRRGMVEVVRDDSDVVAESGLSADVDMAGPSADNVAPPALVDNVETLANVPGIIAKGAAWFRQIGTERSPGSIVCTVTGDVQRADVGEMAMGTPLREVIATIGGGPAADQEILGVQLGVSNGMLPVALLDTPITYEAMAAAGSGLGSASFIVIGNRTSPVALAAGASHFLAIESCGQCTPCKQDGLEIAGILKAMCAGDARSTDLDELKKRIGTVAYGARCNLASQQATVVGALLEQFPEEFAARIEPDLHPLEPMMIAELMRLEDGTATLDDEFAEKRFDWSYGPDEATQFPVDRVTDHRAHLVIEEPPEQ